MYYSLNSCLNQQNRSITNIHFYIYIYLYLFMKEILINIIFLNYFFLNPSLF